MHSSAKNSLCLRTNQLYPLFLPFLGLNLDLDPDIVAAMDEDFDYSDPENQLEDDFVLKANMP